jgi:hypothetical protein
MADGGGDYTGGGDYGGGGDPGLIDWTQIDPSQIPGYTPPGYGMGDRGLGTTESGGAGPGTLTPDEIAQLRAPGMPSVGLPNINLGGAAPGGGNSPLGSLPSWLTSALPWLAGLAPLLGAAFQYNRTGQAANQTVAGIQNAQNAANQILGQNSPFAAYAQLPGQALGNLSHLGFQGTNFGALGNRPVPGTASLAQLLGSSSRRG